jgi:alpha-L-arabinofuranosidase
MPINRRQFLRQTAVAGITLDGPFHAMAQPKGIEPTRVIVDPARHLANLDRRLFGSFLEHIGRAIYGGIYEPESKWADADGLRKDVQEEVRRLAIPMVRYPGGNFVSGYHWQDGVGPKKDRPRVLDRAWNSLETNQFGTDEFIAWCRRVATEPLLAVNLGTGSAANAAALVEYCNVDKGTRWSDRRVRNGAVQPHGVKYWCLGNEMDGPWQIGHMTAADYGRKAADAARQMRAVDRSIQLVACGSSGPFMNTYLEWDRQVLEQCYADVDAISLHRYFNNVEDTGRDTKNFLAMNLSMEKQIREVTAVCDLVQGRLRSRKQLWLSFDEWNVWYRERNGDGKRQHAPHLIEEIYNLEDALLVGGILNSLLRHAKRVRIACLAQLVNVIAPLLTNADKVVRQTIYYPYAFALQHARGQVLDLLVESPTYDSGKLGPVPYLDLAATLDPKTSVVCFLILNRDLDRERELTMIWREAPPKRALVCEVLTGADLKATNTFAEPRRVVPQSLDLPKVSERMTFKVPARAYALLKLGNG